MKIQKIIENLDIFFYRDGEKLTGKKLISLTKEANGLGKIIIQKGYVEPKITNGVKEILFNISFMAENEIDEYLDWCMDNGVEITRNYLINGGKGVASADWYVKHVQDLDFYSVLYRIENNDDRDHCRTREEYSKIFEAYRNYYDKLGKLDEYLDTAINYFFKYYNIRNYFTEEFINKYMDDLKYFIDK